MARAAGDIHMRAGQSEFCLGGVIKNSSRPASGHRMTNRAVLGKSCRGMVRIGGSVPIRLMA